MVGIPTIYGDDIHRVVYTVLETLLFDGKPSEEAPLAFCVVFQSHCDTATIPKIELPSGSLT